jgi:hypothetical protein
MKCLFWNTKGVANNPLKLALIRRLLINNKHDFVTIVEPWMKFEEFPSRWLQRLGYKLFALNGRDNLLPNIWCICQIYGF